MVAWGTANSSNFGRQRAMPEKEQGNAVSNKRRSGMDSMCSGIGRSPGSSVHPPPPNPGFRKAREDILSGCDPPQPALIEHLLCQMLWLFFICDLI